MKYRNLLSLGLLLTLALAPAQADPIRIGALGDSLTEPYANYTGNNNPNTDRPYWGSAGDMNWAEQLQTLRASQVAIHNQARAGATSADLLAQGQHTATADLVRGGQVSHAVLTVGAHDIFRALQSNADPAMFIAELGANLERAVTTIQAAGRAGVVLGNIPNLTVAPAMQALVGNNAETLTYIRGVIQAANSEISRVAAAHGLPVANLFGLSDLALQPPMLSGTQLAMADFFAPDMFHPSTVVQGLFANTILEALRRGYGVDISALRLSNEEILQLANLPYGLNNETFFDVNTYVEFHTQDAPEPSTLVLCLAAGVVGLGRFGMRRVRRTAA